MEANRSGHPAAASAAPAPIGLRSAPAAPVARAPRSAPVVGATDGTSKLLLTMSDAMGAMSAWVASTVRAGGPEVEDVVDVVNKVNGAIVAIGHMLAKTVAAAAP